MKVVMKFVDYCFKSRTAQ